MIGTLTNFMSTHVCQLSVPVKIKIQRIQGIFDLWPSGYTNVSSKSEILTPLMFQKHPKKGSTVVDLHNKILDAHPPPVPNSFNFMQFLGNFGKNCMLVPPKGWRPCLREILDLPLKYFLENCNVYGSNAVRYFSDTFWKSLTSATKGSSFLQF